MGIRFLPQASLILCLLALSSGLAALEAIPVMLVTTSTALASGDYDSGKADVDALFRQYLSRFEQDLLTRLNQDGRYQVSSLSTAIPVHLIDTFSRRLHDQQARAADASGGPPGGSGFDAIAEEDWQRLRKVRYLLIPQVLSWDMNYETDGDAPAYRAGIHFSLVLFDVEKSRIASTLSFIGSGSDADKPSAAVGNACESAGLVALTQLQALSSMRLTTRIGELLANDVILDFGANAGTLPGDRYEVLGTEEGEDSVVTGELVVRDVRPQICFAQVVWTSRALRVGDRIRELRRELIHGSLMASGMVQLVVEKGASAWLSGLGASLRLAFNQGLFWYRPLFDLGFVVMPGASFFDSGYGLPLSVMGGAEVLWRLGIFTVSPNFLVGGVFLVPLEKDRSWQVGGLRAQVGLRLDLQVAPAVNVFVEPAYGLVVAGATFNGLIINAGVTLR